MKLNALFLVCSLLPTSAVFAYEFDAAYEAGKSNLEVNAYVSYSADEKLEQDRVQFLTRQMAMNQKMYENKISYLESELEKMKSRLIEKSLVLEKYEASLKNKYELELYDMKKELAQRNKAILQYQRQIEKMNPSEDLKNVIKINTELASELRKSEGQLAAIQLQVKEFAPKDITKANRLPASASDK